MKVKALKGTVAFNSEVHSLGDVFECEKEMGKHLLKHKLVECAEPPVPAPVPIPQVDPLPAEPEPVKEPPKVEEPKQKSWRRK